MSERHNMMCLLPDTCIGVTMWAIHPCDDKLYMVEAWCYGEHGRIGYWYPNGLRGV